MGILRNLERKWLITPKLLYFFINLQFYTLHQFRGSFAKEKFGIKVDSLARNFGIIQGLTFFNNIMIASMNDKFGKPKMFIGGLVILSFMFFQLFYFGEYIKSLSFMFWVNMFGYITFGTSIPPLLDKFIIDYLNKIPNVGSKTYGNQRLWGTVGYSVANFIIEMCISGGMKGNYNFTNLQYNNRVVTVIAFALVLWCVTQVSNRGSAVRHDILAGYFTLLKDVEYLSFIFFILINGLTRAGMTIFLSIYLKDVLHVKPYKFPSYWPSVITYPLSFINESPVSTCSTFGIIFEIIIFIHAQGIIEKIGLFWPLLLSQFAQLIRFSSYYVLPQDHTHAFAFACMIELFKGVNYGLAHSAGVQLASKLCPPHLRATSQMIYQGNFIALGSVVAGLVFGQVFSGLKEGGNIQEYKMFFAVNVLITLIGIGLFLCKYYLKDNILLNSYNADKLMEKMNNADEVAE